MKEEEVMFQAPPRMLMGVSFLFWGAMKEQALAGLVAAILFEARHWTKLRWSFGEKGFARAWQLCILFLIVSAVGVFQLEDRAPSDFLELLAWLPFILMPIGLAQQYASDRGVPMTTFSFIARRKLALDRKQGRPVQIRPFQLGFPYLGVVLISAGMAVNELKFYAIGVVILLGLVLFRISGKRTRPRAWGVAYLTAVVLGVGIAFGIMEVYDFVMRKTSNTRSEDPADLSMESRTNIGQITNLQQSKEIKWRYFHKSGTRPERLRIASYNSPENNNWRARSRSRNFVEEVPTERGAGGDFEKLFKVNEHEFIFKDGDLESEEFSLVGRIEGLVVSQSVIPFPLGSWRLSHVFAENIAVNSMGTTQVNGPDHGAIGIEVTAFPMGNVTADHDPSLHDLDLSEREKPGLQEFLTSLGVPERTWEDSPPEVLDSQEVMELEHHLRHQFAAKFRYSTFSDYSYVDAPISNFLNLQKVGHCEYFASATAMLMRKAGIPARYVVGYSMREKGNGVDEWILRGTHAHAWCQVYVGGKWKLEQHQNKVPQWRCRGGRWVEVDLTPAGLLDEDSGGWFQAVADRFQKMRTGLILWLARPSVSTIASWFFGLLGVALVIYLIVKLIVTRRSGEGTVEGSWEARVSEGNCLRGFERWLARRVGERPGGMPMSVWLKRHLPDEALGLVASYESVIFGGVLDLESEIPLLQVRVRETRRLITEQRKAPKVEASGAL